MASIETLTQNVEKVHSRYRQHFAGKSRATRDLSLLDSLLSEIQGLAAALPSDADALKSTVDEYVRLYTDERATISAIQGAGPQVIAAWRQAEWSDLTFARYRRGFAGQNRTTRDNWLLSEMKDEQGRYLAAFPKDVAVKEARLEEQRALLEKNLDLYTRELREIEAARAGLSANDHARTLATLANQQFALYRVHFAGQDRTTRRPALLERVIRALKDIHAGMIAQQERGVRSDGHAQNLQKVAERITHHQDELEKIKSVRASRSTRDIAAGLGDTANKIFQDYRENFAGKQRVSVDLAKLSEINDRLQETARTMLALQAERGADETNDKNLTIVLDTLKSYEREWLDVQKAQADKKK